jgi:hypothetical protein
MAPHSIPKEEEILECHQEEVRGITLVNILPRGTKVNSATKKSKYLPSLTLSNKNNVTDVLPRQYQDVQKYVHH